MLIKTTLLKLVPVAGFSAGRSFRTVAGACILSFLLVDAGAAETTTSSDCENELDKGINTRLHGCTVSGVSVTDSGGCSVSATCPHHGDGHDVDNDVDVALDDIKNLIRCLNGQLVVAADPYPGFNATCADNVE